MSIEIYNPFIITIDGHSASGKGTLAKKISSFFNFRYLDTGKLYRLLAYNLMKSSNIYNFTKQHLNENLYNKIINQLIIDNIEKNILYNERISKISSIIATYKDVRKFLLPIQKKIIYSSNVGIVIDGRDTSTIVCPNSNIKIFLTAIPSIRAKRRFKDTNHKQMYKKIIYGILQRDIRDLNRELSPLIYTKDSYLLNTSHLSIHQAFEKIIKKIKLAYNT